MVTKKDWKEFRSIGLLLICNQILHIFGWALVMDMDGDGIITEVYPARVKFRGFGEESQTKAYKNISKYMKENCDTLVEEANSQSRIYE
jgi:hypothetical protein